MLSAPAPPPQLYLPHDACPTLYSEGFPADVSKRELAHIFRPFDGYKGIRLVIKDSKKYSGQKLVMAFVEFATTSHAAQALGKLEVSGSQQYTPIGDRLKGTLFGCLHWKLLRPTSCQTAAAAAVAGVQV